jgi:hypothetical protein
MGRAFKRYLPTETTFPCPGGLFLIPFRVKNPFVFGLKISENRVST